MKSLCICLYSATWVWYISFQCSGNFLFSPFPMRTIISLISYINLLLAYNCCSSCFKVPIFRFFTCSEIYSHCLYILLSKYAENYFENIPYTYYSWLRIYPQLYPLAIWFRQVYSELLQIEFDSHQEQHHWSSYFHCRFSQQQLQENLQDRSEVFQFNPW